MIKKEFITWSNKLSVGILDIDKQHKNFISLINRTHNLVMEKAEEGQLKQILNELIEYARIHFSTEEKYFNDFHYKYKEEHEREHERLILRVLNFYNQFEKQDVKIIKKLIDFLKDWLKNHLKTHDFKYAKIFKEEGLI